MNSTLGKLGEELSDLVEDLDVGGGVAAGSSTDRPLIDVDDFVELPEAGEPAVLADARVAADEFSSGRWFTDWKEAHLNGRPSDMEDPPVVPPSVWLLTTGWKRYGLLSITERPAKAA